MEYYLQMLEGAKGDGGRNERAEPQDNEKEGLGKLVSHKLYTQ